MYHISDTFNSAMDTKDTKNQNLITSARVLQTDLSTGTEIHGEYMSMMLRTGQAKHKHNFLHIP